LYENVIFRLTMKFFKKILVTFVSAIITMMVVYSGYTIYAEKTYEFEDYVDEKVISTYHDEMNDLFNKKIATMVKILKNPEGVNNPNLKSPCVASDFQEEGGVQKCEQSCKNNPDNVSTYCVSVEAMDMYMKYVIHLNKIKQDIGFESILSAEMKLTPVTDLAYQLLLKREEAITKDIEISRRVLEATLTAYNEFMTAFPIHTRYQTVIKNLIKYKNKLKDIREQIKKFPSTFIDTTGTKCS